MNKKLIVAPFGAAAAALALTAGALACTTFVGTFSVSGNATGSGTVVATGTGAMTQTVSSPIAKATSSSGSITVSAGGSPHLPACTGSTACYDINFYNSGSSGSNPGYTNHTTWNIDCMDTAAQTPLNGVNLGSVNIGANGTINGNGSTATYNLGTNAPNTDSSPKESAVCITDFNGGSGNQAPVTIV